MTSYKPITAENVRQAAQVYCDVFTGDPWYEDWSLEDAEQRLKEISETPRFTGFIVFEKEAPAGLIAGNARHSYQGPAYYLAEFCIHPDFQGQGLGAGMLQHLEKELKKQGIVSIFLLTADNSGAERFYKRQGYEVNEKRIVMRKGI
ncbi:GNAT family N-acetyltransferase [Jeotgalibacillus aurantiacus]|uniref:GNAT family N-acetyltransferase n=1 Tax=Jeotgalibacillus aurantiacus TaxID=2763266 RepID=UPI001D0BBE69|nr:GNAT family N-acetyltransferase [Jeotgalibacillus aurantiacus]